MGLKPFALVKGYAFVGYEPKKFGLSPTKAMPAALKMAGMTLEDMDLIELNEAFASQSLVVIRELGLDEEITNVNGGAIALGHPLGCSGARILTTLLHEMKRRAPQEQRPYYGLATLCVGVGMGVSTVVEWIGD